MSNKIADTRRGDGMNHLQKRLTIILAFVVLVMTVGFYTQCQKEAVVENPSSTDKAQVVKTNIVVYVSGLVNHPGVITVAEGSRVIDAVNAAGGVAPGADMTKVNLAQTLTDGVQIDVPGGAQTPAATVAAADGKININTADKTELDKLPGVGPAMAEKIIQYRQDKGLFKEVEELKKVPGIGENKFNRLKDKVTL